MKRAAKATVQAVAQLGTMSLAEQRGEWQRRYGPAPRHRSVELLRRVLAWRIQADVYGGLDAPTRRMLVKDHSEVKVSATRPELSRELVQQLCLEAGRMMEEASADLALALPVQRDLIVERVGHLRHAVLEVLALANAATALVESTARTEGE